MVICVFVIFFHGAPTNVIAKFLVHLFFRRRSLESVCGKKKCGYIVFLIVGRQLVDLFHIKLKFIGVFIFI